MDSNVKMKYIELLKKEISPALGCTEPAAVALCAAGAAALLDQKVKNVVIQVSSYILKNGMNVGIPGFLYVETPNAYLPEEKLASLGLVRLRGSRAGVVHYQLLTRIDSPLATLAKPLKEEA